MRHPKIGCVIYLDDKMISFSLEFIAYTTHTTNLIFIFNGTGMTDTH